VAKKIDLVSAADTLSKTLAKLSFAAPVTHVYDPLAYAKKNHHAYLERFGAGKKEVVLLGMNPGPWGMAQTGVPFGDPTMVRTWLDLNQPVQKPKDEHPKRPITGVHCPRSEVSGTRLWGAIRDHFQTPERFFSRFFVANYCPLSFMEDSGRNRTPDKLPAEEREPLFAACDEHLRAVIACLEPSMVIGVGAFAEKRARLALDDPSLEFGRILHPSPASPAANRGWAEAVKKQLGDLGICQPQS